METLSGKLLIASPDQNQSEHGRAVIYLFQDSPEGTVGVALNQPATDAVRKVWNNIAEGHDIANSRLSIGGPLSGPVLAIHRIENLSDMRFSDDIFAAATQDNLRQLIAQDVEPYRVFFGLSGWNTGELQHEIDSGIWITADPKTEHIFGNHENLWRDLLREKSMAFFQNVIKAKHIPNTIFEN